jgi:hypothetical protein
MAKKKQTRPKKKVKINPPELVFNLASIGCSDTVIGDFIGLSADTVKRRFAENLTKGRAERKIKLHQAQTDKALSGDSTMLIWLGKQDLDQHDKQELEHSVKDDKTVKFIFNVISKKAAQPK